MKKTILTSVLFLTLALTATAQNRPRRQVTPGDTLQSVRVLADGSYVMSIYAPNAKTVTLTGDILPWGKPLEPKVENGVWSFTIPSPVPGTHRYSYVVDGVKTLDPRSPMVMEASPIVTVAPEGKDFFAKKNVPHGALASRWYDSKTFGKQRRLQVWTPAGYERGDMKLPVLYLVHGAGDNDLSWSTVGAAGDILDNLLAEGKIKPMIVVMPNGSIDTSKFPEELIGSIIPFIESNYKVKNNSANRALAGLSMGGLETLSTMLYGHEYFDYYWVMSSGWFARNSMDEFAGKLKNLAKPFKSHVKWLVFSQGGKSDFTYDIGLATLEKFDEAGIKYEKYLDFAGDYGHSWTTWRRDLLELAQRLFK